MFAFISVLDVCGMLSVIYGKSVFSSVLASVDSREMCLYEL